MKLKVNYLKKYFNTIPITYIVVVVFILSMHMHWQGDAIAFSYFMPRSNEDFSSIPFRSVTEIWQSMCNHYMHSTGRFFSHGMAQFFCAFAGQTCFSIINSFAWGLIILLLIKLAGLNINRLFTTLLTSSLAFILFYSFGGSEHAFPFEPPHQIDYVWMDIFNCYWILLFFTNNKIKKSQIPLFIIYSLICGMSNESFAIPIGGATLVFATLKKFKLTPRQWFMAIPYGIGAFFVILAPGNFSRLHDSGVWSAIHTFENLIPALIIPIIYIIFYIAQHRKNKLGINSFYKFIFCAIIINYALGIFVGMGSGTRIVTCANSLIIVLILKITRNIKPNIFFYLISVTLLIVLPILRYISISKLNEKNILIENLYHLSKDGIVIIPDKMFTYQSRAFIVRPHPYMMKEHASDPTKPNIIIRPQTMGKADLIRDTNMILNIGNQAWILIQSRTKPANFIIDKIFLPGIINKKLHSRTIEWDSNNNSIVFDSCKFWKAAAYVNDRPYILSNVRIEKY